MAEQKWLRNIGLTDCTAIRPLKCFSPGTQQSKAYAFPLQFAWKKSHKKQADGVSSDSGDKASARCPEPTMSPKSLRPARRTRKPLKIDNPYAEIEASRQATPVAAPSAPDVPMRSPFATPPDSEDEKEPEVRAPSSGRGRGGRRGGAHPHPPFYTGPFDTHRPSSCCNSPSMQAVSFVGMLLQIASCWPRKGSRCRQAKP